MTVFIGVGFVSTRKQMAMLSAPMLIAVFVPYLVNPDSGVSIGAVLFIAGGSLLCGFATACNFSERLLHSEQLAADRLKVLEEIVEAGLVLNRSEEDGVANTVVDIARRLLSVDRVALLVRDGDELVFTNQSGWPSFPTTTRVPASDCDQFPGAIPIHGPQGIAALLVVPDNERVGLDDDLVGALVTQIGVAIHRETSLAYLRDALLDPLTGVGNRRQAESLFESLHPGDAVVILDLDDFKDLNDRLGHATGDAALRDFGRMLAEQIRASDQVARLGGEEFLVVLRDAGQAQVLAACDRLRQRWDGRYGVTFSAGVAWFVPGERHEQTFAVADGALYRAKNGGRNRTELVLRR